MTRYSLEYDAEMCEWYATADGREYTAETEPQARHWLARQLLEDETPEERAMLERAREAASKR